LQETVLLSFVTVVQQSFHVTLWLPMKENGVFVKTIVSSYMKPICNLFPLCMTRRKSTTFCYCTLGTKNAWSFMEFYHSSPSVFMEWCLNTGTT
jgi:hypothetical protein